MELISFNDGKILIQPNLKLHHLQKRQEECISSLSLAYAFGTEIDLI